MIFNEKVYGPSPLGKPTEASNWFARPNGLQVFCGSKIKPWSPISHLLVPHIEEEASCSLILRIFKAVCFQRRKIYANDTVLVPKQMNIFASCVPPAHTNHRGVVTNLNCPVRLSPMLVTSGHLDQYRIVREKVLIWTYSVLSRNMERGASMVIIGGCDFGCFGVPKP